MARISLALTGADLDALRSRGFRLGGLMAAAQIDAASRFEGPVSLGATVAPGAFLDIGAFCNLSGGTLNNLRAGRYCSVAAGVVIGAHEHPTDWLTTSRLAYYPQVHGWDRLMAPDRLAEIAAAKPAFPDACPVTKLGADVWIGQGAYLRAGITVGTGAVIGARATVTRDVPPYAVVTGTPGRVARLRFPDAVAERLMASRWWDYSIYDLFGAPMDDAEAALDAIEARVSAGDLRPYAGPVITAPELADPASLIARLAPAPTS
ncbi:CatB-related O-acetyltransferase [Palleronia sediminis]|uniref:Chloramphenicol acetyltransferase n=1 Tax=Palleronia sediminis TaxID=2547833 RepID=A0A4R5ZYY3_9RHOB|nr:CatB-related O-acetyltransferase [Palleronia sediminis]TDL75247.1 CatB-related O-acetyltransferase [Palleronia sediminis]